MVFYNYLLAIMILITISIVYVIGYVVIDNFDTYFTNASYSSSTFDMIKLTWEKLPFVIIIGVIIYMFASAQKREYDTSYAAY